MRSLLPLLPALLAAPLPAAAQDQYACVFNTSRENLAARVHLLAASGQEIGSAEWQRVLPMMTVCRPLQSASAVRFEMTRSALKPGARQIVLCEVTVNHPSGRPVMVISGGDGGLQCGLR